jgi:hypothetical protein
MTKDRAREGYYIEAHQRHDTDFHTDIIAEGDHAKAQESSRAVMRRIGISEESIVSLLRTV